MITASLVNSFTDPGDAELFADTVNRCAIANQRLRNSVITEEQNYKCNIMCEMIIWCSVHVINVMLSRDTTLFLGEESLTRVSGRNQGWA